MYSFILVGILVSYLPQHARIITRRSSEGISPWFVLLGTTSGTSAFANIILLRGSQADVLCCRVNSTFSCAAGLLGIAQVGVQWSCFFAMSVPGHTHSQPRAVTDRHRMLLFLIFFPRDPSDLSSSTTISAPNHDSNHDHDHQITKYEPPPPSYRDALLVVFLSLLHALLVFALSLLWFAFSPTTLQIWANFLGLLAAALACVQYIPQIYTTWRLQHVLSLSIPMMLIQTPGSFVFSFSLALRLGAGGWSAWGVYLVTGCLQGVLLGMAIGFELRDRKRAAGERNGESTDTAAGNGNGNAGDDVHERTPLLGEGETTEHGDARKPGANGSSAPRYAGNGHETLKKSKLSIVHNADDSSPDK